MYKLLRSLLAPVKQGEKPFNDLVTKLNEHYNLAPSPIVQRYRYHSRSRAPGESVATFVAQLHSLSEHCKFDTVLEDMLRDCIVCIVHILSHLEKAGLRARHTKCSFMVPSVTFLGHTVDEKGLHPIPDKVEEVTKAPRPQNAQELKSFLGLLSYYSKFVPNLASVLAPLYKLLRKNAHWRWYTEEENAFSHAKTLLTSSPVLVHFNPSWQLVLACDASESGIGAVLAHLLPDGTEHPIGYASRSLSSAEQNYSQLKKEGLSLVFGANEFPSYLLGHNFLLYTDHKPLLALLNEHSSTSPQASARIWRWSLLLSVYEYTLKFRDTLSHSNADALSRLPLPVAPPQAEPPPEVVLLMKHLSTTPVNVQAIRAATVKDHVLCRVFNMFKEDGQGRKLYHKGWLHFTVRELSCQCRMDAYCGVQESLYRTNIIKRFCQNFIVHTQGCRGWKHWFACTCGGPAWMERSRELWDCVVNAKPSCQSSPPHAPFILGSGWQDHGLDCTLITQALFVVKWSLLW